MRLFLDLSCTTATGKNKRDNKFRTLKELCMQRHKSVEKRDRQNKKARIANRTNRSRLKTAVRDVIEAKDKESAEKAFITAASMLDKSAKTGLIHRNKAANAKSRLSKLIGKLGK